MKRLILIAVGFSLFWATAFAGGSTFGVSETNVRDKYLVAGESDQLLMSFAVDRAEGMTMYSLDLTCAPSHGLTTLKLMHGGVEIDSTVFTETLATGMQNARFFENDFAIPEGDEVELSLLVDVEAGTGDFMTACAIDQMIFTSAETGILYDSGYQFIEFTGLDRLVYVDDLNVSERLEIYNIFDEELMPQNLGLDTKDNVLMEFDINASRDIELRDMFIFCGRGDILNNVRLEIDGRNVEDIWMQTDGYTYSRPEHSTDKRIIFSDLDVITGRGQGVSFTLYGDTYNYFSLLDGVVTDCSVIDIMATEVQVGFSDVPVSHPNYDAINHLLERGDIKGYEDGTFKPDAQINRAEFLKILIEGIGADPDPAKNVGCFSDVITDWYARYVCYAKYYEWIEGYPDGTFRPDDTVNYVEALKMLFETQAIEVDTDTKEEWYLPYVRKAYEMGLIDESFDLFDPGALMTRGDVSEHMYRTHIWNQLQNIVR